MLRGLGQQSRPHSLPRFVSLALLVALASVARAQAPFPGTDSTVTSSMLLGSRLYVGGAFHHVGVSTGGAARVDATTGILKPGLPGVVGGVYAIASDRAGGWYLGGDFTFVGGVPRHGLAHVRADGSVAPWSPSADALVLALAYDGDKVLIGGTFSNVNGEPASRFAAVDAATGVRVPAPAVGGDVYAIAVSGDVFYLAGQFSSVGGVNHKGVASVRRSDMSTLGWDPALDDYAEAILPYGSGVIVGGLFNHVGTTVRRGVAAIDTAGNPTAWNPDVQGPVRALAISGSTLYMAGSFSFIGGQPRRSLGAADLVTGVVTAWDPNPDTFSQLALATMGSTVYVGGSFTTIGGQPRNMFAALDAATGLATSFDAGLDGYTYVIVTDPGGVVFGGQTKLTNGKPRSGAAAIDVATGLVSDWNPSPNNTVNALATLDGTIYLGGAFTSVGGQARSCLAAVDTNGVLATWAPAVVGLHGQPPVVNSLAATGGLVFAGGACGSANANYVMSFDATTGTPTTWAPLPFSMFNNSVNGLATDGTRVFYVGPSYLQSGVLITNATSVWRTDASGAGGLIQSGSLVYVSGPFTTVNGSARSHLVALDHVTGAVDPWNPGADAIVNAFALSGSTLYAGGDFSVIGGQPRTRVAALDAASGAPSPWNPFMNGSVSTLATSSSVVYVGGSFTMVDGFPTANLAAIPDPDPTADVPPARSGVRLAIEPPAPQPVHERARVRFTLPRGARVSLGVYDASGRRVRALFAGATLGAGVREVTVDRRGLAGGIYFLVLEADGERASRKFVVLP